MKRRVSAETWSRAVQRAAPRLAAAIAVVVLAPLLAVVAAVVVMDSGRPIIHRDRRAGLGGRAIEILKFRTLHPGRGDERLVAPPGDSRITRAGRVLRRLHLDELPQLINILRGEMAFAGPRPARLELWHAVPASLRDQALALRPGLVSPASLSHIAEDGVLGDYEDPERLYREVVFPAKVAEDVAYFRQPPKAWHLPVFLKALGVIILGRGRRRSRRRVRRLIDGARSGAGDEEIEK